MLMKIKFYLDSAGLPDLGQVQHIGIGSDGLQICQLLYQEYRFNELAYFHHTEDHSIPLDIQFIPFPSTVEWQVGDIAFPYLGEGMSSLLLQLKEQGGLKYSIGEIDDDYLSRLFAAMHPEVVLVGLLGDPMVNYLLEQPYTQDYKWVLRLPFKLEGYGLPSDSHRAQLANESNITLIDSQALIELLQYKSLTLSQFVQLLQRYVCNKIVQLDVGRSSK